MLLARTSAAGTSAWYLTDRLGSVRDLASTSGSVINHVAYDGFGKVLGESNPAHGDRFKFTGREQDAVTGLQYNRARYYDAAIGRWTQEDPIGFAAGDANLYRYVGNGPTNFVDPDGLQKRYWGQSLVEAGRWSWDVGSAGALGAIQGGANVFNSGTDIVIGTLNLPGRIYNNTIGYIPNVDTIGYIPSPDWSYGLVVQESARDHAISRGSATVGLSAASFLIGGFRVPTISIGGGRSAALADGVISASRPVVVIGSATIPVGVPMMAGVLNAMMADQGPGDHCPAGNAPNNPTPPIRTGKWGQGSYGSAEDSLKAHFAEHGGEVGATDLDQYLRKAEGFAQNLRGATKSSVQGATPNVTRYKKLGKYIDLDADGNIISFGSQ